MWCGLLRRFCVKLGGCFRFLFVVEVEYAVCSTLLAGVWAVQFRASPWGAWASGGVSAATSTDGKLFFALSELSSMHATQAPATSSLTPSC